MRLLARVFLAPLLLAALVACGAGDTAKDSDSKNTDTSAATTPDAAAYPTDASVADYCAAYKGENPEFTDQTTIGELIAYFEDGAAKVRETGIPAEFTDAQKKAFEQQLAQFDTAIEQLKALDLDDTTMAEARQDESIKAKVTALETETPPALKEYSSKNC
jgi:hypothetical protein